MRCLILGMVLTLSACTEFLQPNSGLEGWVTVGPQCPVVREGQSCPDLPYAATLELRQAGRLIVRFQSDVQGQFRVAVQPGSYSLEPQSPVGQFLPAAGPRTVTVLEEKFSSVRVMYDSGIR
jgi:hypothetical protein